MDDGDAVAEFFRYFQHMGGKQHGVSGIGVPLTDEYTFKVKAGCRKRIYLLANCVGLIDGREEKIDLSNGSFIPETSLAAPDLSLIHI